MLAVSAPAAAQEDESVHVDVMSQNLYIGADLERILAGEDPAAVLETVLSTNYPSRAAAIAQSIAVNQPDLVGLQEVTLITVFDLDGNVLLHLDYLDILLQTLGAFGQSYDVSSTVVNADVTLPVNAQAGVFARVIDRDVTIHNTNTVSVANPAGANFSTNFTVELNGFPIEFTRGYTSVDATVDGQTFRFVNTHLEVENAPCFTPEFVICQEAQATELIDELYDEVFPVILVGDFNAAPGETAYQTIVDRGYADTWNSEIESGFTCCQSELLDNAESELSRRIDHLFVRRRGTKVLNAATTVLGDEQADRTGEGLWPSDHGAPFASLDLRIVVEELPGGEPDPGDAGDD